MRAVCLVVLVCLAACGPAGPGREATPTPGPVLAGSEWELVTLGGEAPLAGTPIRLSFEAERYGGFSGCNAFGGSYQIGAGGAFQGGELAITLQLCPEPAGVMEQEAALMEALRSTAQVRLAGDNLEMLDTSGRTLLVLTRLRGAEADPASLPGTQWRLVSVDGRPPLEGTAPSLAFLDGGWIAGSAGCRPFVATYGAGDGGLAFYATAMLGPLCADPPAQQQEGALTTQLSWVRRARLVDGSLELATARGETLRFEPLPAGGRPPLEGTAWRLVAWVEPRPAEGLPAPLPAVTDVLNGTQVTLRLEAGSVEGSAGCNRFGGSYTLSGAGLSFGALAATEMACLDPAGVMDQEQRVLRTLQSVTHFVVAGNHLWLFGSEGEALVYTAGG